MLRSGFRWLVVLGVCFVFSGCGGGGVEPGIPKNPVAPVNPTPDMAPDPPGTPPRKV